MAKQTCVSIIVAMAENGVIGVDGRLPWRLPTDMAHFKATTMGKPVIMGRKTFEGIGKPLPGRQNIVISRNAVIEVDGVRTAASVEAALELGHMAAEEMGVDEIMVIGGGEIYAQTLLRAQRIYLTEVHMAVDGDVTFPMIDRDIWTEVSRENYSQGERDDCDFSICVLERV